MNSRSAIAVAPLMVSMRDDFNTLDDNIERVL